jgi:ABC-type cobalamin/Fe3+-siderophores transport system ATPase subunit
MCTEANVGHSTRISPCSRSVPVGGKELAKTIVFITHDIDESLRIADHLVILKDGVVVQQGEPQDIIFSIRLRWVLRVKSIPMTTSKP